MKASLFPRLGFLLVVCGLGASLLLTVSLGHNEPDRLPFISETGVRAPERYLFTFSLSSAAVFFALSAYVLFRQLQDQFQDVADFFYGFTHDDRAVNDDGRYRRANIIVFNSERFMLSILPKANYVVFGVSLFVCSSLMFLAIVDLKEARYYHGAAAALFFGIGILQGVFLTIFSYSLWHIQAPHTRNTLRLAFKVLTLCASLFCTWPLALSEGLIIGLARQSLSEVALHNVGAVNQYLLTLSLLLHFYCYESDLGEVDFTIQLQFNAVASNSNPRRIIAVNSSSATASLFEEDEDKRDHFTITDEDDDELEGSGIRFVNRGNNNGNLEMHEIIPVEVLNLDS